MFILHQTPSVGNHFLAELRDTQVQTDRMRFRANLERLGMLLAYEISKAMPYRKANIQTPLGTSSTMLLADQPVLITIMRAGLPFYQGFLQVFDKAENAFVGAYRGQYDAQHNFQIEMNYMASPSLEGKLVILIDPMLATGKSLIKTYSHLVEKHGVPAQLHIAAAIASKPGIEHIQQKLPHASLWVGAVDNDLNSHSYIIPGLGDAGDLAFGEKL